MKQPDVGAVIERFCALTLEIEQAWTSGDYPLAGQLAHERERVVQQLEQCPPSPEHLDALQRAGGLDARLLKVLDAEIEAVRGRLSAVHRSKQARTAYAMGEPSEPRMIEREG